MFKYRNPGKQKQRFAFDKIQNHKEMKLKWCDQRKISVKRLWKLFFEETGVNLDKALVTCKEEQAFEGFYKQLLDTCNLKFHGQAMQFDTQITSL